MISETGLHWARHELERRLSLLDDELRWAANDAFVFFKGKNVGYEEVKWLLAERLLAIKGAEDRFENQLALAEAAVAHLGHADDIRSFIRGALERAVESFRKGVADPNLPHPGVFEGVEEVRGYFLGFLANEKAALELYGLAAEDTERLERLRYGSVGRFAWDMYRLVGRSHDQHVAALIGPAVGLHPLEPSTVRKCFDRFKAKYAPEL